MAADPSTASPRSAARKLWTPVSGAQTPLVQQFWQDLQPTPGRLNSTLRITLASVIALVLLMVWQMPFASIGLYFIFLVGRDSPSVSFRTSIFSSLTIMAAIAVELAVVILTDNDPMARVLSVAVITFIGGVLVVASSLPTLGSAWALIYCTVIAFWESHAPADTLVKNSLWLLGTFCLALACAVSVEYIFGARHPAAKLQEQRSIRYQALETMFSLYAQGADPQKRLEAATRVSRLAIAGQSGMMELYNAIVDRNLDTGTLSIAGRVRITMLAQLLDVAAAFGMQNTGHDDPELRRRCARIAEQCHALNPVFASTTKIERHMGARTAEGTNLLDRVEAQIHTILTMPAGTGDAKSKELAALPSKKIPFFIPGALRSKDTIAFGLKISLCATLCYIFYNAVAWPGISTAVTTVIVTGLSTSGAIKQRLIYRLLGSVIGGLIMGLGATAFLFPYMDSITSLTILVGFIAFFSAWVTGGPRFNYVGLQIAFSFYIVAFEGFRAPVELAPARDRLIGIVLALGIMWFVFDQIWPVRTVTVMRRTLASVLRNGANLFRLDNPVEYDELLRQADTLRDRAGKDIAALRTMNEAVEYEFGIGREQQIYTGDLLLRAAIITAALFWNQLTVLHTEQDEDFLSDPGLIEMRRKIAEQLDAIANAVVQKTDFPVAHVASLLPHAMLMNPRYGEYTHNIVARYEELQTAVAGLNVRT
jgi:multidrug resistance protein MdtO